MTINIEKMRSDMAEAQKWETRKFLVSALVASAALLGAGAALGNYFTNRSQQPAQPVTQILQYQYPPGTVITIPPAKP